LKGIKKVCYDSNARPPDPTGTPSQAGGQDLELVSSDGAHFAAYIARATVGQSAKANIIIYPDAGGLDRFYKELAMRFAEQGIDAIAIDYFGRTAGVAPRDAGFDKMPHIQQLQFPTLLADARAAVAYLRNEATTRTSTFTTGFCLGGALSLLTAAQDLPLAGAICLYAVVERPFQGMEGNALDQAVNIRIPVLGLFGGADQYVAPEEVSQLDDNLDTAGVEHEIITYPGAPHSFFDRKYDEYAQESADAWRRILGFIGKHTK
jgi:carboxymethylenebutenolidase